MGALTQSPKALRVLLSSHTSLVARLRQSGLGSTISGPECVSRLTLLPRLLLAETLLPGGKRILGLSKKDELLRRKELMGPPNSGSSLASALTATCSARAGALLRTPMAADVVVEVARGGAQVCICVSVHDGGSL